MSMPSMVLYVLKRGNELNMKVPIGITILFVAPAGFTN